MSAVSPFLSEDIREYEDRTDRLFRDEYKTEDVEISCEYPQNATIVPPPLPVSENSTAFDI